MVVYSKKHKIKMYRIVQVKWREGIQFDQDLTTMVTTKK